MSAHKKKVADLEDNQITVDPGSIWAKVWMVGIGLAILGFAIGFAGPSPFKEDDAIQAKLWTGYLNGFMFALSLGLGGLVFVIIQHLVRANWSVAVRRIAEHAMFTLPFVALGGIPLLLGPGHHVFEWMHTEHVLHDPMIKAKLAYLNHGSFKARFGLYLAIWSGLSIAFWNWSRKQDDAKSTEEAAEYAYKQRFLAPIGLIAFALSMTFGAFDFMMSLDPHWFSTMYGVYIFAGVALAIHSLLVVVIHFLQRGGMLKDVVTAEHFHDLGKFMFGFTVFWTYIGFSQYFLIWYANIPEETHWFMYRAHGQWLNLSYLVIFGRFVIPFFLLLRRGWKRNSNYLVWMAFWIIFMEFIDIFWLVQPPFAHHAASRAEEAGAMELAHHFHSYINVTAADVGFFVAFVGVFLTVFGYSLKSMKLVPIQDPRLEESLNHENF
ncbi:hypothetical protein PPSIR1_01142 [Plesiocystis pacifica SIR-1]|uniref:Quinol:cytochrome c oxidoreductase quinone-binding subunit 2 n=1 Tax=Plesiocystis pacifica SIR-1 TaxID=391625 RepID=A6GFM4_9BACT|nr:hypothetical protein [Plesiocystis pacifica]EDM75338.1 hypothetical protein PPSIR1_01142 [Plesiocystis pacifica SIR-1]